MKEPAGRKGGGGTGRLSPSRRAAGVQLPIIPTVAGWIAETPGTISLGQGVVHYGPPPEALAAIPEFLRTVPHHRYIPDAGLPELRKAFEKKLRAENGIEAPFARRILVTVGANQAFLNAVLAICDPGDEVILLWDCSIWARHSCPQSCRSGQRVQVLRVRSGAPCDDVIAAWAASTCTATDYHVLYGSLSSVSSYALSGARCDLGTSGAASWTGIPAGSLWFVVVSDDNASLEGSWGRSSAGAERGGSTASGQCSLSGRSNAGTCP